MRRITTPLKFRCRDMELLPATDESIDQNGTVLVLVILSIGVMFGLFALGFEVFLMVRDSNQADADLRGAVFAAAVGYVKTLEATKGDDTASRGKADEVSSSLYASSLSSDRVRGGINLIHGAQPGTISSNWQVNSRDMVHKFGGYQRLIDSRAGDQTQVVENSRAVYDSHLSQKGLFPIIVE